MNNTELSVITIQEESLISDFQGTVIDIESIGDFDRRYKGDSREYRNLKQVIFGYINSQKLGVYCADNLKGIVKLAELTKNYLGKLERPFYAFNCSFESSIFFHQLGVKVDFNGELQRYRYESKKEAVGALNILNYNDPFYDDGLRCLRAWNNGDIKQSMAHNRACLLKERDILIKRGYRDPDDCRFVE